jgi:hypothetical protein
VHGLRPASGIVEVRQFGSPGDPWPTLALANRSDIDLDRQGGAGRDLARLPPGRT